MSNLGLTLAWSAVQVALALLPALALYAFASRRGPTSGSWMAAASLVMIVVLTVLAFVPERRAIAPPRPKAASQAPSSDISHRPEKDSAPTLGRSVDLSHMFTQLHDLGERLGNDITFPAARYRRPASVAGVVLLLGTGVGLLHLAFGLWAVRECRRRGKLVDDLDLNRTLETLRVAMGCPRRVEIREVPDLTTAATAGWRRPLVLLPDDWRSWNEEERRAVLAHELAHIRRADYAVGLMARVAVALHFYHPLVRWMAGRLQLQQELAADALGARFAGGQVPYLLALSRMALRQKPRATYWPARAFLPAKGTLIKRIRMLQVMDSSQGRPWSWPSRTVAAVLLLGVAVGVSTLRSPARAEEGAAGDATKKTRSARPNERGVAIDLSYVPTDTMGLIAFRPSATFRHAGMSPFAAALNMKLGGLVDALPELGFLRAKCPLRVEDVEQATLGFSIEPTNVKVGPGRRMIMHGLMLRTVAPFDWKAQILAWWPAPIEVRDGDRVYYKFKNVDPVDPKSASAEWLEYNPCVYFPDDRTMVLDSEHALLRLIRRAAPVAPEYAQGEDWKRVEHSLFAIVCDNRDRRWARNLKPKPANEPDAAELAPLFENAERWVFALSDQDEFRLSAIATCGGTHASEATVREAETLLATLSGLLGPPKPGTPAREHVASAHRVFKEILAGYHVIQDGTAVFARPAATVKIADVVSAMIMLEANDH